RANAARITDSVRALLALRYPRHEVVLVHDGGIDGHLAALIDAFELYAVPPAVLVNVPTGAVRGYYRSRRHGKLFVIDKPFAGHADDLNAALNASRFPYILTMDVGTALQPDALSRLMRPFLIGQRVAAVAGTVRIADGERGAVPTDARARVPSDWLAGVRAVQSLRDEVYDRIGWNRLGGQHATHGGVLLHRRDHLLEVDGYRHGPADPELELLMRVRHHLRVQRLADAVPVLPEPVGWTDARTSLQLLARGRDAVYRGQLEVLRERRASLFTSRLATTRLLASAHLLAVAVLAPVLELAGYLLLLLALLVHGPADPFVPLFVLAVPGFALLLTLWAVAIEAASVSGRGAGRGVVRLCVFAVAEQLGFRQWLAWRRLRAMWAVLRGGPSGERERVVAALGVEDAALSPAERARAR
ncbi:MAG TPA: glycosyltransferase family 2 protein, partial [Gemmatimonadaceae bacterium]|nr:glycosyltransferase family 2 protein [Gemmatimonadaceae bacterium]